MRRNSNSSPLTSQVSSIINSSLLAIWGHLYPIRRIQIVCLLFVMLAEWFSGTSFVGCFNTIFLSTISNPEYIWRQEFFNPLFLRFSITDSNQLIIPLTILFVISVILSTSIRLFNVWINGRLAAAIGSELSCKAYRLTLLQDYNVHLSTNSSQVLNSTITFSSGTVLHCSLCFRW